MSALNDSRAIAYREEKEIGMKRKANTITKDKVLSDNGLDLIRGKKGKKEKKLKQKHEKKNKKSKYEDKYVSNPASSLYNSLGSSLGSKR